MTSWLRVIGLRVAVMCGLVATACATHALPGLPGIGGAPDAPALPFALLDAFDQAFTLAYDAAERRVAELEHTAPPPVPHDVFALLRKLDLRIAEACEAASTALDVELAVAASLPAARRTAVLGCIERHLDEARRALGRATDPLERAEYEATCERLREIRSLV